MPKKLPYGNSNFTDMIESGYAYVDKTRFIELLEHENNRFQFFIRPRRFGKSLFLSILDNYYGLDKSDAIFKELYIGKKPTPEKNKYAILKFNFSGLDTENHDYFRKSFSNRIQECVKLFLERYNNIFKNTENDVLFIREKSLGVGALDLAYSAAIRANTHIFVIIDEYDHFANNLIAMGETYKEEVKAGGIVRSFYE